MKNRAFLSILAFMAVMTGQSGAYSTFHVPGEYPTIQSAINASSNGDIVIVSPGTYTGNGNRDVSFLGKAITVRSEDPDDPAIVATTVINCQGSSTDPHRGFYFHNSETGNSILKGFTFTNGYGGGGGIRCENSSPTIRNCKIKTNNAGYENGGGIFGSNTNVSIINCEISDNSAALGCGVYITQGVPIIERCVIRDNRSIGGGRGALYFEGAASPMITNCIITGNTAYPGGICCWSGGGTATITNCTIVNNYKTVWGGAVYWKGTQARVTNCICRNNHGVDFSGGLREIYPEGLSVNYTNIQDNGDPADWKYVSGTGNIDAEPLFLAADHYYLGTGSPCIDAGTNSPIGGLPATDMDGSPRSMDGNNDGVSTADMGAYEFDSTLPHIILCSPLVFTFYAVDGGSNPVDQILSIRNGGAGLLSWLIAEDCGWLEVSPNSGESAGETDEVNLSINSEGLSLGTYQSIAAIHAEGAVNNPQIAMVNLIVARPKIELSTDEFEFFGSKYGTNPPSQILTIRNNSIGTLSWTIDCGCEWLVADPSMGSSTGEADEVVLSVNCTNLEMDSHYCQLIVSDPCAVNNPQIANITLYVSGDNMDDKLLVPSEYSTIQLAIDYAREGDTVIVADGIYTGIENRDIDFKGKAITVKSENGPTHCIVDCQYSGRGFEFVSNEGQGSILEGLTITNAYIAVMCEGGAGIYVQGSSPTIKDCVIVDNHAELAPGSLCFCFGGGIYIGEASSPQFINCIVSDNSVGDFGRGGGLCCQFSANVAMHNCIISNNTALRYSGMGGGVYCESSSVLTMTNCTIADNSALLEGGGVFFDTYESPVQTVNNCIVWANSPDQIYPAGGTNINVTYSDIQGGGWTGAGNINADPRFVSGPWGNYYLSQIPAGQFPPSPCVDAGSDTAANLDMDGFSTRTDEVNDQGIVDMGYHYQAQLGNPDLNGDGKVNFQDFAILALQWYLVPGTPSADIAPVIRDAVVDMEDLAVIAANWLK